MYSTGSFPVPGYLARRARGFTLLFQTGFSRPISQLPKSRLIDHVWRVWNLILAKNDMEATQKAQRNTNEDENETACVASFRKTCLRPETTSFIFIIGTFKVILKLVSIESRTMVLGKVKDDRVNQRWANVETTWLQILHFANRVQMAYFLSSFQNCEMQEGNSGPIIQNTSDIS